MKRTCPSRSHDIGQRPSIWTVASCSIFVLITSVAATACKQKSEPVAESTGVGADAAGGTTSEAVVDAGVIEVRQPPLEIIPLDEDVASRAPLFAFVNYSLGRQRALFEAGTGFAPFGVGAESDLFRDACATEMKKAPLRAKDEFDRPRARQAAMTVWKDCLAKIESTAPKDLSAPVRLVLPLTTDGYWQSSGEFILRVRGLYLAPDEGSKGAVYQLLASGLTNRCSGGPDLLSMRVPPRALEGGDLSLEVKDAETAKRVKAALLASKKLAAEFFIKPQGFGKTNADCQMKVNGADLGGRPQEGIRAQAIAVRLILNGKPYTRWRAFADGALTGDLLL